MSVVINIKGKLNIKDIINDNIGYGVRDTAYRLCKAPDNSKSFVVFNNKVLGRGIDIDILDNEIELKLPALANKEEVNLIYDLTKKICDINNIKEFEREGQNSSIDDIDVLLNTELDNVINDLETIKSFLNNQDDGYITIFGVTNPIDISTKLIDDLDNDYDKFQEFINRIQHLDAYYSAPIIMRDKYGKRQGVFLFNPNKPHILPIKPVLNNAEASKDLIIDKWYIGNEDGLMPYDNFIEIYKSNPLYDANHIIVQLDEVDYYQLLKKYNIM